MHKKITLNNKALTSLIKDLKEGILALDDKGNLITYNSAARYLLGFSFKESLSTKKLTKKFLEIKLNHYMDNKYFSEEKHTLIKVHTYNNYKHILHIKASPLELQSNVFGSVLTIRNISKEKEIENIKTEFLSILSHELRTPLLIINEGVTMILDEITGQINDKQKNILNLSKLNLERLTNIIENLTDFANIEKGAFSLHYSLEYIDKIAKSLIEKIKHSFDKKHINIKLNIEKKLPKLLLDQNKIYRVFYYLIDNAIKFCPEKGIINIAIKTNDKGILTEITDNGPGIPFNNLKNIFNKFTQKDRQSSIKGDKGLG